MWKVNERQRKKKKEITRRGRNATTSERTRAFADRIVVSRICRNTLVSLLSRVERLGRERRQSLTPNCNLSHRAFRFASTNARGWMRLRRYRNGAVCNVAPLPPFLSLTYRAGGKRKMECIFETLSFNNHITMLVYIFTINIHYSYLYVANYIKKISVLHF